MTPPVLDPTAQARPTFATTPVSPEAKEAWEQLGPMRDALMALFAVAAPHLSTVKDRLESFASEVEVRLEFLHDHDWHLDAPTVLLRYTLPSAWTSELFEARDHALAAWYSAPSEVRHRFPPLREAVTVPNETSV